MIGWIGFFEPVFLDFPLVSATLYRKYVFTACHAEHVIHIYSPSARAVWRDQDLDHIRSNPRCCKQDDCFHSAAWTGLFNSIVKVLCY